MAALNQAEQEVAKFDESIASLCFVHKECDPAIDWLALASTLSDPIPVDLGRNHALSRLTLVKGGNRPESENITKQAIEAAKLKDTQLLEQATLLYLAKKNRINAERNLALRILAKDSSAYCEAMGMFPPCEAVQDLGSTVEIEVQNAGLVGITMKSNGSSAIPTDEKTLTPSGKLSIKPFARSRYNEIYQRYLASCALRVARDVFSLLPVDSILLHVTIKALSSMTGHQEESSILSVVFSREKIAGLNFGQLDPVYALNNFHFRQDFKASRKDEVFAPISTLTSADIPPRHSASAGLDELFSGVRRMRDMLKKEFSLSVPASVPEQQLDPNPS